MVADAAEKVNLTESFLPVSPKVMMRNGMSLPVMIVSRAGGKVMLKYTVALHWKKW